MGRDDQTDASRTGTDRRDRSSYMRDMPAKGGTLADEKNMDPNSVGTASDYRGTTNNARR